MESTSYAFPFRIVFFYLVATGWILASSACVIILSNKKNISFGIAGRPGSSEVPRNPLTRRDVSSIPANGIFLTKKIKNKNKNAQRVEND